MSKRIQVARPQSSSELAAKIVGKWFHTVTLTTDGFTQDALTFDPVQDAVMREYVRDHGPVKPGEDLVDRMCAQEAGYLIGVQVGLRLRGGVR